jgi:hypothetical protein
MELVCGHGVDDPILPNPGKDRCRWHPALSITIIKRDRTTVSYMNGEARRPGVKPIMSDIVAIIKMACLQIV